MILRTVDLLKLFALVLGVFFNIYSLRSQSIDTLSYMKDSAKYHQKYPAYLVDSIIEFGKKYIGRPHCMGGTGEECLDCSGFMFKILNRFQIQIGRDGEQMAHYGTLIYSYDSIQKGDLLFFTKSYQTSKYVTHVGIYMEGGNFIHASASKGVEVINLKNSNYWWSRYLFAKRIFN